MSRLGICEAYWLYSVLYNGTREAAGYAARLRKLEFRARDSLRTPADLEPEGQGVFRRLAGWPEDYEPCGECGYDHEYEYAEARRAHA